jgi:hypothetical protein
MSNDKLDISKLEKFQPLNFALYFFKANIYREGNKIAIVLVVS